VLLTALDDPEPLARSHAAWALGRVTASVAAARLRERLELEAEESVRDAIRASLAVLDG